MIRVLTGATLIDGTGAGGALSWPDDAEVIDVRGRTTCQRRQDNSGRR